MSCSQVLNGITLGCETSVGGIKEVYIAKYADVEQPTVSEVDDTKGLITEITMIPLKDADGNPIKDEEGNIKTAKFEPYQFRKQTGSMTSTLNVDETAGINYVSTEVSLVFTKMETTKRIELSALAMQQLVVIVKDGNNKYWYLGYDDYVSAVAGSGNSGTAKGDSNNYSITLKDESDTFPFEVSEEAVLAVL